MSARSGASTCSDVSGSPSATASMTTSRRPLTSAGTHASSGACSSRAMLVMVSGASPAHSLQTLSTRWACSQSQASAPAYTRCTGSRSNSSAVTTPKPPPPPAGSPQQVAVLGLGGAHERAVGQHQLDGRERAALQAAVACVPAQPTAERGADDADAGAAGVPGGEPQPAGPVDDVTPADAGTDPGGTPIGVHLQLRHGRGAEQDGVLEPAGERRRTVAGALRGDLESQRRGRADHVCHLGREGGIDHRRRADIGLQVPRQPDLVERGIAGQVHGTAAQPTQHVGP